MITVEFKKIHSDAKLPTQAHPGDVGYDLYSIDNQLLDRGVTPVHTGIQLAGVYEYVEGSFDYECHPIRNVELKIEGRSGLAKSGLFPVGGIVDPAYRGELIVLMCNVGPMKNVQKGDKIAQIVFYNIYNDDLINILETKEVQETERGSQGFGSTDNKQS